MSEKRVLRTVSDWEALAEMLSKCPQVTRYDSEGEKEAWTLAHAFADLEESFRAFVDRQLPALTNKDLSPQETFEFLLDIGEEFRHILYHIHDPKFYRYLEEPERQAQ